MNRLSIGTRFGPAGPLLAGLPAPRRFGVSESVEHQLAPGDRGVDGQVRMTGSKADAGGCLAVSRPVSAVAQLRQAVGDGRYGPRMRLTPSLLSGPEGADGCSPSASWHDRANSGRSAFSSTT